MVIGDAAPLCFDRLFPVTHSYGWGEQWLPHAACYLLAASIGGSSGSCVGGAGLPRPRCTQSYGRPARTLPNLQFLIGRSTDRTREMRRVRGVATTGLPQSARPVNFPPRSAILAIVAALSKPAAPCCHLKSPRDSPD